MAEHRKKKEIEILAPAGSFETFQAVIRAGADAVYLGGSQFGARAYANNFCEEELLRAIDYAHIHGREVYLTVNTLLKEDELREDLCDYLRPYYEQGLDAVIVQDLGALATIRSEFPQMDIHTSTQMTVTSVCGAAYMKELGASRVVTAREMTLSEICRIHEEVDVELETFVHGALCYCYSGQCLLSSMLGGRSGNRGRCAQPCRLPYEVYDKEKKRLPVKGEFVLSPKDLCGVESIPTLAESGVYSFKIEGRMKQAEYAAGVVSVYRECADRYLHELQESYAKGLPEVEARKLAKERYAVHRTEMTKLLDLGNRSGFTDGYYHKNNGKDMITFGKPNHAKTNERLQEEIRERYVHAKAEGSEIKEKIKGILRLKKESFATIELTLGDVSICIEGDLVQAARNQPLSEEKVQASMRKTGNTPFEFEELFVDMDDDIFLPVQAINQLRREALEKLEETLLMDRRRTAVTCADEDCSHEASKDRAVGINISRKCISAKANDVESGREIYVASVETRSQANEIIAFEFIDIIYFDSSCYDKTAMFVQLSEDVERTHLAGKRAYYILPAIFRNRTMDFYEKHIEELLEVGLDGVVVKSYDAAAFAGRYLKGNMELVLDHSIYTWNDRAKHLLWELEPVRDTIPLELNRKEIAGRDNRGSEMVIYGYLPLMTSAQCVHANTAVCDKNRTVTYLKDRYGIYFPVKNHCNECYNMVYNTTPLVLFGMHEELTAMDVNVYRLSFTIETKKQVQNVLHACKSSFVDGVCNFKELLDGEYTNGHYKRGVE